MGTVERSTVNAGGGDDTVSGKEGGGLGGDFATALTIRGEEGNDALTGGDGDDGLKGGGNDDHVSGDTGRDELAGGYGNDRCLGGRDPDPITGCENGHP